MAKRKSTKTIQNPAIPQVYDPKELPQEVRNEADFMVKNGLSEAVLGNGWNPLSCGAELSQVNSLFRNNRWYLVSNFRQLLSELFVEHGLVQTIVTVPVDDAFRGGIEIKSGQLDPKEVKQLIISLERDDDLTAMKWGLKWDRLYGGGGVMILTDQECEDELDVSAIGPDSPLEFRAVDMWELFWDKQNTEGYNMELQEEEFEHYNYYAKRVNKSRVMKLKGLTAPSFIRPRLRGWGFSVVESMVRSINQYLKSTNLTYEVLDEFKLDIFRLKNLANTLLKQDGDAQVRKRVAMANSMKNFQHALVLDMEDEYNQKQLSFAGLAEVMQGIRIQIASDMRMPLTKLFGVSASGFSSGEDDIENYNAMIESEIRGKAKYHILKMCELKCQKLFGDIPDDLEIEFKPLRIMSAEQEENVKTQKFNRLLSAKTAGELSTEEFRNGCNVDNLFGIQLAVDDVSLGDIDEPPGPEADRGDEEKEQTVKEPKSAGSGGKSTLTAKEAPKAKNSKTEFTAGQATGWSEEFRNIAIEHRTALAEDYRGVIQNPGKVDENLWAKAKRASQHAFEGQIKYAFVTWWYKEHGGTFQ